MSSSLDMIKKLREEAANSLETIEKRRKEFEDPNKSFKDDRFWRLTKDSSSNGSAVIRFISKPDAVSIVKKFVHNFKSKSNRWFIENCPRTLGLDCPACEHVDDIWGSHDEKIARELVGDMGKNTRFFSNILVVEDEAKPENVGKVFLFEYGSKLRAKIADALAPVSTRQKSFDPFNPFGGADFVLISKLVDKQVNYDASYFEQPKVINLEGKALTDKHIIEILDSTYDLTEIIDPKHFKSYEDLKKHFNRVLNKNVSNDKPKVTNTEDTGSDVEETTYSSKKGSVKLDIEDDLPF